MCTFRQQQTGVIKQIRAIRRFIALRRAIKKANQEGWLAFDEAFMIVWHRLLWELKVNWIAIFVSSRLTMLLWEQTMWSRGWIGSNGTSRFSYAREKDKNKNSRLKSTFYLVLLLHATVFKKIKKRFRL